MEWRIKSFKDLDVETLYKIIKLRVDVFIVEQNCPYHELDELDYDAKHIYLEDDGEIIAYLRVLKPESKYKEASLGRVITKYRKKGYGLQLLNQGIFYVKTHYPSHNIRIEAQCYAQSFYEKVGFKQVSEPFDEDGIMHIEMLLNANELL